MQQPVRAKFHCTEQRKYQGWGGHPFFYGYKFQAVTGGNPENDAFFASTPSGSLEIAAIGADLFEAGKDYYLDITPVPEPAPVS